MSSAYHPALNEYLELPFVNPGQKLFVDAVDSISPISLILGVQSTAICLRNRQISEIVKTTIFVVNIFFLNRAVIDIDKISTRTISNWCGIDESFLVETVCVLTRAVTGAKELSEAVEWTTILFVDLKKNKLGCSTVSQTVARNSDFYSGCNENTRIKHDFLSNGLFLSKVVLIDTSLHLRPQTRCGYYMVAGQARPATPALAHWMFFVMPCQNTR